MQINLRTQRALGWGDPSTNKIFIHKPTPRSNFCLLAPAQFSKHTPPFGRVDLGGPGSVWAPANKILLYKPIPRSNFCSLAPAQFLILQGISDGVTIAVPLGAYIWGHPWLGAEPGWNEEPMPNFGVMACVGPAAGCRTHIHTHTHILSSLYSRC